MTGKDVSMETTRSLLTCSLLLLTAATTGIAPAMAQEEVPAETFASLPRLSGARLSPDGQYLAFFSPMEGRRHLVVSDLSGKAKTVVVPPPESLDFDWLHWANEDRIVFSMSFFATIRLCRDHRNPVALRSQGRVENGGAGKTGETQGDRLAH